MDDDLIRFWLGSIESVASKQDDVSLHDLRDLRIGSDYANRKHDITMAYYALTEYNAWYREQRTYFIQERGNEEFLQVLRDKLPEECGFELIGVFKSVKGLVDIGNKVAMDSREPYVIVEKVIPAKVVELKFIDNNQELIEYLTLGRFLQDRATQSIKNGQKTISRLNKKERQADNQGEQPDQRQRKEKH